MKTLQQVRSTPVLALTEDEIGLLNPTEHIGSGFLYFSAPKYGAPTSRGRKSQ